MRFARRARRESSRNHSEKCAHCNRAQEFYTSHTLCHPLPLANLTRIHTPASDLTLRRIMHSEKLHTQVRITHTRHTRIHTPAPSTVVRARRAIALSLAMGAASLRRKYTSTSFACACPPLPSPSADESFPFPFELGSDPGSGSSFTRPFSLDSSWGWEHMACRRSAILRWSASLPSLSPSALVPASCGRLRRCV